MSLVCYEDKKPLKVVDEAFCVTTLQAEKFSAVCAEHILQIPDPKRLKERVENGLDVHFLFSRPNELPMFTDNLSLFEARFGDYRFSISEELARIILPHTSELYLG